MKQYFALAISLAATITVTCNAQITEEDFDSIQLFTLRNSSGVDIKATNYGAIIT